VDARHKAGHDGEIETTVIASEAKQSIAQQASWIASSLRSSQ
jgi:hypothetical protein